jgi:hypothetical protein
MCQRGWDVNFSIDYRWLAKNLHPCNAFEGFILLLQFATKKNDNVHNYPSIRGFNGTM